MPCPVPGCDKAVPRRSIFCVDHYFLLPTGYSRLLFRTKFACERAETDGERDHLQEQLTGYVSVCVAKITEKGMHG